MTGAAASAPAPAGVATPRGLVWVSDQAPGIRRIRVGADFAYVGPDGKRLRKAAELQRIRALAIPPAYEDVWICVRANGHIQATGRDARGRKQYRYHRDWRLAKDADKFERMLEFGAALPRIRKRVAADLAAPVGTMPRRATVLATIVRLLDTTYLRIGNEEYARENKSFGLTTLRNRHAAVSGDRLRLRFRGKSGKEHEVASDDPRVAKVVRRCQAMPGQELFQYVPGKAGGMGLGFNGGQMIALAIGGCFCNDLRYMAEEMAMTLDDVAVDVSVELEGQPMRVTSATMRVHVTSANPNADLAELLRRTEAYTAVGNSVRSGFPLKIVAAAP